MPAHKIRYKIGGEAPAGMGWFSSQYSPCTARQVEWHGKVSIGPSRPSTRQTHTHGKCRSHRSTHLPPRPAKNDSRVSFAKHGHLAIFPFAPFPIPISFPFSSFFPLAFSRPVSTLPVTFSLLLGFPRSPLPALWFVNLIFAQRLPAQFLARSRVNIRTGSLLTDLLPEGWNSKDGALGLNTNDIAFGFKPACDEDC